MSGIFLRYHALVRHAYRAGQCYRNYTSSPAGVGRFGVLFGRRTPPKQNTKINFLQPLLAPALKLGL
jgi:hypothetical protein